MDEYQQDRHDERDEAAAYAEANAAQGEAEAVAAAAAEDEKKGFKTPAMLREWYMQRFPDDPVMLHDYWLERGYKWGWTWAIGDHEGDLFDALCDPNIRGNIDARKYRRFARAYAQGREDANPHRLHGFVESRERIGDGTPFAATLYIIPIADESGGVEWMGRIQFDENRLNFEHRMSILNDEPHIFYTDWVFPGAKSSGAHMYNLLRLWYTQICALLMQFYITEKNGDRKLITAFTWLREGLRPFAQSAPMLEMMGLTPGPLHDAIQLAAEIYANMDEHYAELDQQTVSAPPLPHPKIDTILRDLDGHDELSHL